MDKWKTDHLYLPRSERHHPYANVLLLRYSFPWYQEKKKTALTGSTVGLEDKKTFLFWFSNTLHIHFQTHSTIPFDCLSWDSVKNFLILSDGIAKEIPAVTFNVLIPITSPSWRNKKKRYFRKHDKP